MPGTSFCEIFGESAETGETGQDVVQVGNGHDLHPFPSRFDDPCCGELVLSTSILPARDCSVQLFCGHIYVQAVFHSVWHLAADDVSRYDVPFYWHARKRFWPSRPCCVWSVLVFHYSDHGHIGSSDECLDLLVGSLFLARLRFIVLSFNCHQCVNVAPILHPASSCAAVGGRKSLAAIRFKGPSGASGRRRGTRGVRTEPSERCKAVAGKPHRCKVVDGNESQRMRKCGHKGCESVRPSAQNVRQTRLLDEPWQMDYLYELLFPADFLFCYDSHTSGLHYMV